MRISRTSNYLVKPILIILALFSWSFVTAKNQAESDSVNILDAAQQIDIYIEDGLRAEGLERNAPVTDEFFVRRV